MPVVKHACSRVARDQGLNAPLSSKSRAINENNMVKKFKNEVTATLTFSST
jgi:hypothetical protein